MPEATLQKNLLLLLLFKRLFGVTDDKQIFNRFKGRCLSTMFIEKGMYSSPLFSL